MSVTVTLPKGEKGEKVCLDYTRIPSHLPYDVFALYHVYEEDVIVTFAGALEFYVPAMNDEAFKQLEQFMEALWRN